MKKSIIVILIALIVTGFAFAGTLTGSAGLRFDVALDKDDTGFKNWSFVNASSWQYTFDFEVDTTAIEVGEHKTDLWAELAIKGSASFGIKKAADDGGDFHGEYAVDLSKAEIHYGEDLVIGLLKVDKGVDYAKHYTKNADGSAKYDTVKDDHEAIAGFTVNFKDWYGGFATKGSWGDETKYTFYGHARTPEFKFAEDAITVQAGGYGAYANNSDVFARATYVGGGAKAGYASDKFTAGVGFDAMYDDETFMYEIAANAKYTVNDKCNVNLDVYATPGKIIPLLGVYAGDDADKMKLDAKLSSGYTFDIDENTEVGVTGYVEVTDALIDGREITISATESAKLLEKKALELSLTETYKVYAKTLDLVLSAKYTAAKFVASAKISPSFQFANSDADALTKLGFECEIYSEAIIENAKIGLKYSGADFVKAGDTIKKAGTISAYATISFK
ncbi:MAG: hypothetical protein K6E89_07830 [Sphaerochaetaceae bacterium]|nr:hypothetical protein [Sphaerochaetaceae bacterium]